MENITVLDTQLSGLGSIVFISILVSPLLSPITLFLIHLFDRGNNP